MKNEKVEQKKTRPNQWSGREEFTISYSSLYCFLVNFIRLADLETSVAYLRT